MGLTFTTPRSTITGFSDRASQVPLELKLRRKRKGIHVNEGPRKMERKTNIKEAGRKSLVVKNKVNGYSLFQS